MASRPGLLSRLVPRERPGLDGAAPPPTYSRTCRCSVPLKARSSSLDEPRRSPGRRHSNSTTASPPTVRRPHRIPPARRRQDAPPHHLGQPGRSPPWKQAKAVTELANKAHGDGRTLLVHSPRRPRHQRPRRRLGDQVIKIAAGLGGDQRRRLAQLPVVDDLAQPMDHYVPDSPPRRRPHSLPRRDLRVAGKGALLSPSSAASSSAAPFSSRPTARRIRRRHKPPPSSMERAGMTEWLRPAGSIARDAPGGGRRRGRSGLEHSGLYVRRFGPGSPWRSTLRTASTSSSR